MVTLLSIAVPPDALDVEGRLEVVAGLSAILCGLLAAAVERDRARQCAALACAPGLTCGTRRLATRSVNRPCSASRSYWWLVPKRFLQAHWLFVPWMARTWGHWVWSKRWLFFVNKLKRLMRLRGSLHRPND